MSAGTRPVRFIPYGGSSAQATIGRKRKPQMDKDYYSVDLAGPPLEFGDGSYGNDRSANRNRI